MNSEGTEEIGPPVFTELPRSNLIGNRASAKYYSRKLRGISLYYVANKLTCRVTDVSQRHIWYYDISSRLHAYQYTLDAPGLSASPAELPILEEASVTEVL